VPARRGDRPRIQASISGFTSAHHVGCEVQARARPAAADDPVPKSPSVLIFLMTPAHAKDFCNVTRYNIKNRAARRGVRVGRLLPRGPVRPRHVHAARPPRAARPVDRSPASTSRMGAAAAGTGRGQRNMDESHH